MLKLLFIILIIVSVVIVFGYIQDTNSQIVVTLWEYEIGFSLSFAVFMQIIFIAISIYVYKFLYSVITLPRRVSTYFEEQKVRKGYALLSNAFFALEAGDLKNAEKNITKIDKKLPQEHMAVMLKCKLAVMKNEPELFKKHLHTLLQDEDTRGYALRYLYSVAKEEGHSKAMLYFAKQANLDKLSLEWSLQAVVDSHIALDDYASAIHLLESNKKRWRLQQPDKRLAVLYLAQIEKISPYRASSALELAKKAYGYDEQFVPCVCAYAKALIGVGQSKKAMKILEKNWSIHFHPDIVYWYAWADLQDGPYQRLLRLEKLMKKYGEHIEITYALCKHTIASKRYEQARDMLRPLLDKYHMRKLYLLMAEIEDADRYGSVEKSRYFYQKAIQAPMDNAWVADDYVSEQWFAISPIDKRLDSFEWKKPPHNYQGMSQQETIEDAKPIDSSATDESMHDNAKHADSVGQVLTPHMPPILSDTMPSGKKASKKLQEKKDKTKDHHKKSTASKKTSARNKKSTSEKLHASQKKFLQGGVPDDPGVENIH